MNNSNKLSTFVFGSKKSQSNNFNSAGTFFQSADTDQKPQFFERDFFKDENKKLYCPYVEEVKNFGKNIKNLGKRIKYFQEYFDKTSILQFAEEVSNLSNEDERIDRL